MTSSPRPGLPVPNRFLRRPPQPARPGRVGRRSATLVAVRAQRRRHQVQRGWPFA